MIRLSAKEARGFTASQGKGAGRVRKASAGRSKYGAVKETVNNLTFHSKREAARYAELVLLAKADYIRGLQVQVAYPLSINGILIARYVADFRYLDMRIGATVVEDCKGVRLPVYVMKKKLMKAIYDIDILET